MFNKVTRFLIGKGREHRILIPVCLPVLFVLFALEDLHQALAVYAQKANSTDKRLNRSNGFARHAGRRCLAMVMAVCMVFTTSGMTFSGAISQDSGEDSGWQDSSAGQRPGMPSKPTASDAVKAQIDALAAAANAGEAPDEDAVKAARAAYDALTDEEKAAFDPDTLALLVMLEEALAAVPMAGDAITILVNDNTTPYGGADLSDAVGKSGVAADTITTLKITAGKVTAEDWNYFTGGTPGDTKTRFTALTTFEVADAVTSVADIPNGTGSYPLFHETITHVTIPQVIVVGNDAFSSCINLTTVSLPKVTSVGEYAFYRCNSLSEVDSLSNAITIGRNAFYNCTSLDNVSFPVATIIGQTAFLGCAALTNVNLPEATSIGENAFSGCKKLATVTLPAATSVGINAFFECTALATVTLPAATSIGTNAFYDCTTLATVTLPAATSIGENAFYNCAALATLKLGAGVPTVTKANAFTNCPKTNSLVLVDADGNELTDPTALAAAIAAYKAAPDGNTGDNLWWGWTLPAAPELPKITITVNGGAAVGGTSLSDAVTKSGVTANTITALKITAGTVTAEDWKALKTTLPALETFEIDAAVTTVADIPNGTSSVYIFPASITIVTIPQAIRVGNYAFRSCKALTTVSLPAATSIGDNAFSDCTKLTSVSLPAATSIGDNAFYDCSALTSATLPTATRIGNYAFFSCESLATLKLGATPPSVGNNVFNGSLKTNPLVILDADGNDLPDDALTDAQAIYDKVIDGMSGSTATDGKWYGWRVREATGYQPSNGGVTFEDGNIYANGNALTVVKGSSGSRTNIYYTKDPDKTPIDLSKVCMPDDNFGGIENGFYLSWWSDGSAAIGPILFGGSKTKSVGSVELNLEGGELFEVYGSGGDATTQSPSTASVRNITINASGIFLNSGIMAVGYNGKVTGRVTVNVTGGNISNLRGYSWYGQVDGRTSTTLTGGEFSSVYVPPTLSIGGGVKILALGDSYEGVIIKGGTRTKGVDTFAISSPLQNVVNVHLPEGYTGGTIATGAVAGDLANIKLVGKGATGAAMALENGKIVVTYGNKPVVPVTGVSLDKPTLSLEAGRSQMLTATVAPANATNKTVTWTSNNAAVATVADGLVTAVKVGTATITVTTADGSKTATCAVTVTATTTKPAPGGTLEAPLTQETVDGVFGEGNATLDNTTKPPKITIDNSIIPQKPIEIETDVTIDLGGNTITGKPGQPPIIVGDGDKVIIGGSGTVAGGDTSSGAGGNGITGGTGSDITIGGGTTVEGGNGTTGGDGITSGGSVTVDGNVNGGNGSSGAGGDGVDTSGGSGNITIKPDGSASGGNSTGGNGNGGSGTNAGGNTTIGGNVTGGAGAGSGSGGSGATDSTGGSGSITVQPGGSAQGGTGGTAGGSGGDGVQNNGGGSTIVDGNGSATGGAGGAGGNGGNGTTTGDGSTTVGGSTTGGAGGSTSSGTGGSGGSGSTSTGSGSIEVGSGGSATGGTGGSGSTSGGNGGNGTTTGDGSTTVGGSTTGGAGGSTSSGTGGAGGSGSTSTGGGNISVGGDVSGGTGGAGATGGTGGNGTSTGGGTVVNGGGSATGGTGGAGSASGGDGGNGTDTSGSNTTINGDATGGSGGSGRPGSNGAGGDGGSGANQGGGLVNGTGNATGGNGGSGAGSGQGGSGGPGVGGGATAGDNLAVVNGKSVKIEIDGNPGTTVTIPDAGQAANAVLTPEERNNPNITEVKVTLNVEQKTAEKPDEAIVEAQKPAETVIGAYFDITLYRTITENGVESDRKQVSNTQGKPLSIRITIPQNMRDGVEGSYVVVLVHDGVGSKLKTQQEGIDLIFQSSQYSTYAIAYTPGGAPTPTPPPSDDSGDESSSSNDQYDFWMTVKESIQKANPGEVIKVNANGYDRLPWSVLEALRVNSGVSMVITWNGTTITIPAGKAPQSESGRVYWPLSLLAERVDGSAAQVVPAPSPSPIPAINPATGGPGRFVPVTGGGEQSTVAAPTPVAARKPITPIQLNAITPPDAGFEQNAFAGTPDNPAQADGFAPMLLAAGAIGCGVWLWKKRHEDEQSSEL